MSTATVTALPGADTPPARTRTTRTATPRKTPAEKAAEARRAEREASKQAERERLQALHTKRQLIMRRISTPAFMIIGLGGMYASFWHISGLATRYGQTHGISLILPLIIDGLMTIASLGAAANPKAVMPYITFGMCWLVTIAANAATVQSGHGWFAYVLGTWPAIAIVLAIEPAIRSFFPPVD